ncbi:hypothetical protein [Streptomyces sp. NPDC059009]|uniref:hypothetical protein n=1 Tax=Streptomyces sp. NPDC059009 TaxID=3346694 RepID=UPI0036B011E7
MFEYELHQLRTAEQALKADHQRLVREARDGRRTARRSARHEAEGRVSAPLLRRARFTRAA